MIWCGSAVEKTEPSGDKKTLTFDGFSLSNVKEDGLNFSGFAPVLEAAPVDV